jgi:hypothetical protein
MDVDTLIAHLERAPRHNDYIHVLDDQKQTLSTIYNNMPWPMLMLNANMIALNQMARSMLKTKRCMQHSYLANIIKKILIHLASALPTIQFQTPSSNWV